MSFCSAFGPVGVGGDAGPVGLWALQVGEAHGCSPRLWAVQHGAPRCGMFPRGVPRRLPKRLPMRGRVVMDGSLTVAASAPAGIARGNTLQVQGGVERRGGHDVVGDVRSVLAKIAACEHGQRLARNTRAQNTATNHFPSLPRRPGSDTFPMAIPEPSSEEGRSAHCLSKTCAHAPPQPCHHSPMTPTLTFRP
jgi:hypothetical protein